jgi:hypothetical protein
MRPSVHAYIVLTPDLDLEYGVYILIKMNNILSSMNETAKIQRYVTVLAADIYDLRLHEQSG